MRPGGTIAFIDWIAGTRAMVDAQHARFLRFMSFPNVLSLAGYRTLLETAGCTVEGAEDSGRSAVGMTLIAIIGIVWFGYSATVWKLLSNAVLKLEAIGLRLNDRLAG
jgi:hypothetical protein